MTLKAGPFVFVILATTLGGCTAPEPQKTPEPPAVFEDPLVPATPDENTDRIRSHSAFSYDGARGGGALRSPEDAYVLWNRHYGEDIKVAASDANRAGSDPVEEIVVKSSGKTNIRNIRNNRKEGAASKDRSVYGRKNVGDKSVYRKKKKENDA